MSDDKSWVIPKAVSNPRRRPAQDVLADIDAVLEGFTCPKCKRTSYHPEDKRQGYCGACHEFTS